MNKKNSKGYFNEIAPNWDKMRSSFFSNDVRKTAYELAGIQKNKVAADIGAGTGFITEGLLEEGLKVIAVDQSENMLKGMREKFKNYEELLCLLGDSDALPLTENSVDYVFANMFLHHVAEPAVAVKEMYRILKKDGKLVITDLDEHNFTFLKSEQHDVWLGFDRNQIEKWFFQAGFREIAVSCVGCNCCSDSAAGEEKANISIFAAYGVK